MKTLQLLLSVNNDDYTDTEYPCDTWILDARSQLISVWNSESKTFTQTLFKFWKELSYANYDYYVIVYHPSTTITDLMSMATTNTATMFTNNDLTPAGKTHLSRYPCGPIVVKQNTERLYQILFFLLLRIEPEAVNQLVSNAYEAHHLIDEFK